MRHASLFVLGGTARSCQPHGGGCLGPDSCCKSRCCTYAETEQLPCDILCPRSPCRALFTQFLSSEMLILVIVIALSVSAVIAIAVTVDAVAGVTSVTLKHPHWGHDCMPLGQRVPGDCVLQHAAQRHAGRVLSPRRLQGGGRREMVCKQASGPGLGEGSRRAVCLCVSAGEGALQEGEGSVLVVGRHIG